MKDKLKEFIDQHRHDFDAAAPPDLWPTIAAQISKQPNFTLKKNGNMLKYGFGASALIIGSLVIFQALKPSTAISQQTNPEPQPAEAPALPQPEVPTTQAPALEYRETTPEVEPPAVPPPPATDTLTKLITEEAPLPEPEPIEEPTSVPPVYNWMVSGGGSQRSATRKDTSLGRYYTAIDTLFSAVAKLEVVVENCQVTINSGSKNEVQLTGRVGGAAGNIICLGTRSYMNRVNVYRYEKKDSVLRIIVEGKALRERIKMTKEDQNHSRLDFTVPAWIVVEVKSASGNIVLAGIESPLVQLKTSYGHINVCNTKTKLVLNSGSGNIVVKNHKGQLKSTSSFGHQSLEDLEGDLALKSGSGNITLKNLLGAVDANSSFGNQTLEDVRGDVQAHLSSGHLTAKNVNGNIEASSSFGKQSFINVVGNIHSTVSSGNVVINGFKGALGISSSFGSISGKAVTLLSSSEFKSSSGNINIELLNDMKDLRFDLSASSGRMLVEKDHVKNTSDHSLLLGDGKIIVKGITSFGNQKYH